MAQQPAPKPKKDKDERRVIATNRKARHDYAILETYEAGIEDFGYGKGYQVALDEWRVICSRLDELRRARGMAVIALAHATVRTFKNPLDDDFDRYQLKMHEKSAGFLREWFDAVMFAQHETAVERQKDAGGKVVGRGKGSSTGVRLLHTVEQAGFHAKNRYGLPAELELRWEKFAGALRDALAASGKAPRELRREIDDFIGVLRSGGQMTEAEAKEIRQKVKALGDDVGKLAKGAASLAQRVQDMPRPTDGPQKGKA